MLLKNLFSYFCLSYRTEETLFEGVAANDSLASPVTTTWCDCTNSSSQCHPYEIVQTCDFVEGQYVLVQGLHLNVTRSGPSCSKLMMSLANVTLKL